MQTQCMEEFDQKDYYFRLYDNKNKLSMKQIKAETGCDSLVNLAYFKFADFSHQSGIKIKGEWVHNSPWVDYFGLCIDKQGYLYGGTEKQNSYEYVVGCPTRYINCKVNEYSESGGKNGWTYIAIKQNGNVVVWLNTKDKKYSTDYIEKTLLDNGCIHIFRFDGSWSSQGIIKGTVYQPSQYRCCRSWLLIYKKNSKEGEEDKMGKVKTICIDPGHGDGCVNGSLDGTYPHDVADYTDHTSGIFEGLYAEDRFAWDLSQRLKELLEYNGFKTVFTRKEGPRPQKENETKAEYKEYKKENSQEWYPSLQTRCDISNNANADLFISLHTNACVTNKDKHWSNARGLSIYVSENDPKSNRVKFANSVIRHMREAGVIVRSSPVNGNMRLVVTRDTNCPAILVEHGFHTNKEDVVLLRTPEYRQKLAVAEAKAICEYFGVGYKEKKEEEEMPNEEKTPMDKAKELGFVPADCSDAGNVTFHDLVSVLDKLNILK